MRYINYYDNDTLSIFEKKLKKQESITVRISDKHVGLMSYQKGGQLLDSISADVKIMPLIRIVLAIQFCYNVKYVR